MKPTTGAEIIIGGIVIADVIVKPVEKLPPRGQLTLVSDVSLSVGGCAANTASAMARLGLQVALIGRVGNDEFGYFLRRALENEKIDCTALITDHHIPTSITNVMVSSDGERSFLHRFGANAELMASDFRLDRFTSAKHLHLAGIYLNPRLEGQNMRSILKNARRAGLSTSIDTVWDPRGCWLKFIEPSLPLTDIFFANEGEAKMITGRRNLRRMADFILSYGVRTVVIKRGIAGSCVFTQDAEITVPAFKVKSVDTTGAGDAYTGAFLLGVLRGWGLEKTALFASAAGAISVTGMGTTAVKGYRETLNFMNKTPKNEKQ
ncbi:MAG: carbohydrate kinase family protein [bacterium]